MGIAVKPGTGVEAVLNYITLVDMVLVMTVEPGFGGQSFIPSTLNKLREARTLIDESGLTIRLEVDGGVSPANIAEIAGAGADTFVAGSAIFNQPSYEDVIAEMRRALEAACPA